jgi:hypothetical protein
MGPSGAPFGAPCAVDADCASNMCREFRMKTVKLCTHACTLVGAKDPSCLPPSDGMCTPRGYCRL